MAESPTAKKRARKKARVPVGASPEAAGPTPAPEPPKAPAAASPGGCVVSVVDDSAPFVALANGPVFYVGEPRAFAEGELSPALLARIEASPRLSVEKG